MRILRQTFLAILLSAALFLPGSRQSFSGLEWLRTSYILTSGDTVPCVPARTGMSRHGDDPAEVVPLSAKEHLREGRRPDSSSGEHLCLPARIFLFIPSLFGCFTAVSSEQCTSLFLSGGVIRRKLVPRVSPFFSF